MSGAITRWRGERCSTGCHLRPPTFTALQGELPPGEAGAAYQATLETTMACDAGQPPRFDLILLGMGDDGHTASLFPGMPALGERAAWVADTAVPAYVQPQVSRVTLTLPVLNAAREVLFIVTGRGKAEAVQKVFVGAERQGAPLLPAAQVRPYDGVLAWLLDEPAASLMKE